MFTCSDPLTPTLSHLVSIGYIFLALGFYIITLVISAETFSKETYSWLNKALANSPWKNVGLRALLKGPASVATLGLEPPSFRFSVTQLVVNRLPQLLVIYCSLFSHLSGFRGWRVSGLSAPPEKAGGPAPGFRLQEEEAGQSAGRRDQASPGEVWRFQGTTRSSKPWRSLTIPRRSLSKACSTS